MEDHTCSGPPWTYPRRAIISSTACNIIIILLHDTKVELTCNLNERNIYFSSNYAMLSFIFLYFSLFISLFFFQRQCHVAFILQLSNYWTIILKTNFDFFEFLLIYFHPFGTPSEKYLYHVIRACCCHYHVSVFVVKTIRCIMHDPRARIP